jgi:metal-responsive CopG/Arc/MetJ family transcriptional regulator
MRMTVEVSRKTLASVQSATGIRKNSPAIAKAIEEYLAESQKKEIIRKVMSGKTNYSTDNKVLEAAGVYDPH